MQKQDLIDFAKERIPGVSYPVADLIDKYKFFRLEKKYDYTKINWIKKCAVKKRCFIIATGPSLTLSDINALSLSDEDTFGVNSICKLFNKTEWRPTFYCISDKVVYNTLKDDLDKWNPGNVFYSKKEFDCNLENSIPVLCRAAYPLYPNSRIKSGKIMFSGDATKCVYTCATVVYFALQIAVTMGYKQIYLLGTDCNYTGKQQYSILTAYNMKTKSNAGLAMFKPYEEAKRYAEEHDIQILNASRGGMLEVFPRVNLKDVLQ